MSSVNNIAKITQCRKSHLWWEFHAETLYVCPKHGFGHTYKVSVWNSHKKNDFFAIHKFPKNILEGLLNVSETTPWWQWHQDICNHHYDISQSVRLTSPTTFVHLHQVMGLNSYAITYYWDNNNWLNDTKNHLKKTRSVMRYIERYEKYIMSLDVNDLMLLVMHVFIFSNVSQVCGKSFVIFPCFEPLWYWLDPKSC